MTTIRPQAMPPVKPVAEVAIVAELRVMGFDPTRKSEPRRLIACLGGREKVGKTHFALTAPEPIFLVSIDIGTEGVVGKFQDTGKEIYVYDVRMPRTAAKDYYVPMWENLKKVFAKIYSLQRGSVVVDTASEVWELARLAKFGKLSQIMPQNYTEVNNEFREVLRLAYDSPMNSIFIHKMKPKYINNARTSEYEISGFGDMEYNSQINLVAFREATDEGVQFSVFVKDCRQNPDVDGEWLEGVPLPKGEARVFDPLCNFELLLSRVHGGAKK